MENILIALGAAISIIGYFMLAKRIEQKPNSYSFTGFLLWAILEGNIAVNIYLTEDGLWQLSAVHALGCLSIAVSSFMYNKLKFGPEELFVSVLIIVSFTFSHFSNHMETHMATTICALFAGMLQMNESRLEPDKKSVPIWILLLIGSIFTFFATNDWDATSFNNEKFYSMTEGIENIVLVFLNMQRKKY